MNPEFYVYAYLDPRKPGDYNYTNQNGVYHFDYEPFYVGKGKGRRAIIHLRGNKHNTHFQRKIDHIREQCSCNPIIVYPEINLLSEIAYKHEEELVLTIGRSDLKNGPLCNKTKAGLGGPCEGHPVSIETREKISKSLQGHIVSNEVREILKARKGWKHTPDAIEKIIKAQTGRKLPDEWKNNLRKPKSAKGKRGIELSNQKVFSKLWKIIKPNNEEIFICNLNKFCRENNLTAENMRKVSIGERLHHKGYKCEQIKLND